MIESVNTPVTRIGVEYAINHFLKSLEPQELARVDHWADDKRILTGGASSLMGKWRTDFNPPQREIMQCLSHDHPCNDVVLVSPTQWGKTEILLNFIFQAIDQRSGSILCGQPTIGDARKFIRQRFKPAVKKMQWLAKKIGSQDGSKGGDADFLKELPNGTMIMAWSNSAANLSAMPIAWLLCDEIDRWAFDADGQGCPLEMAIARTDNFPDCKRFFVSTPANHIDSRIWPRFKIGDQRLYLVPCWKCNHMFFMDWPMLEWEKDSRGNVIEESVLLQCPKCEYLNEEKHKTKALEAGKWVPQNPGGEYPSFRINALYKPRRWRSWSQMVMDYRKSKRTGRGAYKVWYNTQRALPWKEKGVRVEHAELLSRKEKYTSEVPNDVLILTAGVDVQDDRLEAEVVGWGAGRESWGIDFSVFWGDTSKSTVWMDLDRHLKSSFMRGDNSKQFIAVKCIDALGHRTDIVYKFCKPRESLRVFPAYGKGGDGLPILGKVTRRHKSGVYLFPIGTDTCKDEIIADLKVTELGENYCHFPDKSEYGSEYFRQLTAEIKVREPIKNSENKERWVWKKIRTRNEVLDIRQLNRAALEISSVDLDKMSEPYLAQPVVLTPRKSRRNRSGGLKV